MKKEMGIILGILAFVLLSNIINKLFFEKSSEQIAKEKCKNLVNTAEALVPGGFPIITVTIDSKTYNCN
ncbi:MAG: hypothetical protein ACYTXT_06740 [Nostoc sp.]